ncbi:hypothetical protein K491DRAFT_693776 [Lophiostoma macrostomum CBS 122681]|uniref:DUF7704 domain-containing protein n=1 Tax=Lophiostoma macrostomum CBS 122681 TaxID=1314788 RepID=A0A6A6T376_9PLEO|nr:hypothetical protein K491DRAFT_693776 [Lophiostoma macrostomum CBS 122681]
MALGTVLPFWPALLFTYLEPIALLLGTNSAFSSPSAFVTTQTPSPTSLSEKIAPVTVPDGALILAYTSGNIFILLALLAVICTAVTRESRVAKAYLLAVAIGDLGHIYASWRVLGKETMLNFGGYNDMMWGNIGASAFLHVNRLATILGVFGRIGGRR